MQNWIVTILASKQASKQVGGNSTLFCGIKINKTIDICAH